MQDNFNVILGILPFFLYVRVCCMQNIMLLYYALNVHLYLICVLCALTMCFNMNFKCLYNTLNLSFSF